MSGLLLVLLSQQLVIMFLRLDTNHSSSVSVNQFGQEGNASTFSLEGDDGLAFAVGLIDYGSSERVWIEEGFSLKAELTYWNGFGGQSFDLKLKQCTETDLARFYPIVEQQSFDYEMNKHYLLCPDLSEVEKSHRYLLNNFISSEGRMIGIYLESDPSNCVNTPKAQKAGD